MHCCYLSKSFSGWTYETLHFGLSWVAHKFLLVCVALKVRVIVNLGCLSIIFAVQISDTIKPLTVTFAKAFYGTLPAFAKTNRKNFILYFIAPVLFNIDRITGKVALADAAEIRSKYRKIAVSFLQCVVVYSVLIPVGYNLFPSKRGRGFMDLFFWGNLLNNYVAACKSPCARWDSRIGSSFNLP